MLRSTASIVLLPLLSGVAAARLLPSAAARAAPACPSVGILATLLLVTGGAANSAAALLRGGAATWKLHVGAVAMVETLGPRRFGQRPPSQVKQRPGPSRGLDRAGHTGRLGFLSGSWGSVFTTGAVLLPLLAGAIALRLGRACGLAERGMRTLTMETMVKSPTLAYVLALRHFGPGVAAAPAASMVWLAAVGALTATVWRRSFAIADVSSE